MTLPPHVVDTLHSHAHFLTTGPDSVDIKAGTSEKNWAPKKQGRVKDADTAKFEKDVAPKQQGVLKNADTAKFENALTNKSRAFKRTTPRRLAMRKAGAGAAAAAAPPNGEDEGINARIVTLQHPLPDPTAPPTPTLSLP